MIRIENREEYDYALSRGYDALYDPRFEMDIALRKEVQKSRFGGNNARGNSKFYRYCLEHLGNVCEECGATLSNPSAVNVSHILSRGAHPEKAHDPRNVNILCYAHHAQWENGDRGAMRIWTRNERIIEQLKKDYA